MRTRNYITYVVSPSRQNGRISHYTKNCQNPKSSLSHKSSDLGARENVASEPDAPKNELRATGYAPSADLIRTSSASPRGKTAPHIHKNGYNTFVAHLFRRKAYRKMDSPGLFEDCQLTAGSPISHHGIFQRLNSLLRQLVFSDVTL